MRVLDDIQQTHMTLLVDVELIFFFLLPPTHTFFFIAAVTSETRRQESGRGIKNKTLPLVLMSTVEAGPSIIADFYSEKALVRPTGHRNTLETEAGAADGAESTARKRNEPTDAKGAEVSSPSLPEDLLS